MMKQPCTELVRDSMTHAIQVIRSMIYPDVTEAFYEYGLCFEYKAPNPDNNQLEGYYQWLIDWGGPSTEFRFYVNIDHSLHKCEYWYNDWFDAASATPDMAFAQRLWSYLRPHCDDNEYDNND